MIFMYYTNESLDSISFNIDVGISIISTWH